MPKKKTKTEPPRLVVNCTPEYHQQVKDWAREAGFSSTADYIKSCINQDRTLREIAKRDR